MFTDMVSSDSFLDLHNYEDTLCKKRKIQHEPGEEPIVEFVIQQERETIKSRIKTRVSLWAQEDAPSQSNPWSFEDYWPLTQTTISSEKVEQLNSNLEQSFSPDLGELSFPIPISEGCWSPFRLPEQFDSIWEETDTASTLASSFSPVEFSNDSESEDEKDEKSVEKKKKGSSKSHKNGSKKDGKKPQNKMKNFPGLIMQRIKTLSKKYSKFFAQVILKKKLFLNEQEKFKDFISKYNKNNKTWATIEEYLRNNLRFARGYLKLVYTFMSDEYQEEFDEWVNEGRMSLENQKYLKDMKNKKELLRKFKVLGSKFDIDEYNFDEVNYDK